MRIAAYALALGVMVVAPAAGCCGLCSPFGSLGTGSTGRASADDDAEPAVTASAAATARRRAAGKPVQVAAKKLIAAYEDEKAGDRAYGGRRVTTTGWVIEVDEGMLANPTIMIGPEGADPLEDSLVQCRVTDDFVDNTKVLRAGAPITVVGDCEGKRLGQVRLEECEIVSGGK